MDRKSLLALLMIFVIILLWEPYKNYLYPPEPEIREELQQSVFQESPQDTSNDTQAAVPEIEQEQQAPTEDFGSIQKTDLPESFVTIETQRYRGVISTKGGTIEEWALKDYDDEQGNNANIILNNNTGNLNISFISKEGLPIDMRDFDFIPVESTLTGSEYWIDATSQEKIVELAADMGENRRIIKRFTFLPESFHLKMDIVFENCNSTVSQQYDLTWGTGIRKTEQITPRDPGFFFTMAMYGDDDVKLDVGTSTFKEEEPLNGTIHWIATRSKYFSAIVVPTDNKGTSARMRGEYNPVFETIGPKNYVSSIRMPLEELRVYQNSFLIYLGPVDKFTYDELSKVAGQDVNFTTLLDYSKWIRWLSLIIYRLFSFLHEFIPNYGAVIVIFSLLINVLLFPLTAKSYKSMKKMQDLQPLLNDLKEKYKDEPQKLQQAQIQLYKELKINPVGGCLPMVLQMPVFFAIYPIFRSIELRGAPFMLWMQDLSLPDTVAHLPISLWMFGDQINILTLIYAVSLFIQQKIMMKDPKQKMLVYLMPIMLLLFFNQLSSGFVLYFIIFNLTSITQRYLIRDTDEDASTKVDKLKEQLQQKKKVPPKKKKKK
ncbi:membrane protein insertase YidC [candidate division KSB1 bacterium]